MRESTCIRAPRSVRRSARRDAASRPSFGSVVDRARMTHSPPRSSLGRRFAPMPELRCRTSRGSLQGLLSSLPEPQSDGRRWSHPRPTSATSVAFPAANPGDSAQPTHRDGQETTSFLGTSPGTSVMGSAHLRLGPPWLTTHYLRAGPLRPGSHRPVLDQPSAHRLTSARRPYGPDRGIQTPSSLHLRLNTAADRAAAPPAAGTRPATGSTRAACTRSAGHLARSGKAPGSAPRRTC